MYLRDTISGHLKTNCKYLVSREGQLGVFDLLDGRELGEKNSSFGGGIVHLAILQQQRGI